MNKKLLTLLGVIIGLILIAIPLVLTNPKLDDYEEKLPKEFSSVEAKKESVVYKEYGVISCYIATKQISSSNVERISYLGIGGQILSADKGATRFIANTLVWAESLLKGTWITISLTITSVITGIFLSVFLALGKMSEALGDYEKALKYDTGNKDVRLYALCRRGTLYRELKDYKSAIQDFSDAIKINNQDMYTYYYHGLSYAGISNYELALSDFQKAKNLGMENMHDIIEECQRFIE